MKGPHIFKVNYSSDVDTLLIHSLLHNKKQKITCGHDLSLHEAKNGAVKFILSRNYTIEAVCEVTDYFLIVVRELDNRLW
jgi:hypothetical protein